LLYAVFTGPFSPYNNLKKLFVDLVEYKGLSRLLGDISDQGERRTAKTVAKIIANCKVVLGTSEGKIPETHGTTVLLPADTTDNENALIVGSKLPENSYMVQLSRAGKLALLRSGLVPGYERLRLLRGKTSVAMVLNGMQAIGCLGAVFVRAVTHLGVSPIESIGSGLSLMILAHSFCHFATMTCSRPLIFYLSPGHEQDKVSRMCSPERLALNVSPRIRFREVILIALALAFMVLYVLPLGLGILFLDRLPTPVGISDISAVQRKAINLTILALGPLLFFFLSAGSFFLHLEYCLASPSSATPISWVEKLRSGCFDLRKYIILPLETAFGVIVALMATIAYWREYFDVRTNALVHIWPFIG